MKRNRTGYTLVELVLSMAVLSILIGLSLTIYRPLYLRNELNVATHTMVLSMYRAEMLARSGAQDSSWGVHIASGTVTIFRGSSYASRVTSSDETASIPSVATVSGTTDYVFSRFSGTPTTTGATTFNVTSIGAMQISVSAKGVVNF